MNARIFVCRSSNYASKSIKSPISSVVKTILSIWTPTTIHEHEIVSVNVRQNNSAIHFDGKTCQSSNHWHCRRSASANVCFSSLNQFHFGNDGNDDIVVILISVELSRWICIRMFVSINQSINVRMHKI